MDTFTRQELDELVRVQAEACVSIYMPMHIGGGEAQQDRLLYKNLLKEAERLLAAQAPRGEVSDAWLEPARAFGDDALGWEKRAAGLAVFISHSIWRHYQLPVPVNEQVVAAPHFFITPLLPLLERAEFFFVLALSRKQVRLFQANGDDIHLVQVEGLPRNLEEALQGEVSEKQSGFRSLPMSVGGGGRQAIFYGQGAGPDERKDELLRYSRVIATALHTRLKDESAPLIIAGTHSLARMYREANTFPFLVDEIVEGNPDKLRPAALRERAARLLEPHLHRARREALAQYEQLMGTGRSSSDVKVIVPAAFEGRIHALFVNSATEKWGSYDPTTKLVTLGEGHERRGDELSNLAALETLRHHGQVFALTPEEMPKHAACAALFRY